jgi:hydrogenase maturation protease
MTHCPESAEAVETTAVVEPVLVLGVGNVLLADEGAGVHAMRELERSCRLEGVRFADGGTLSFTLAELIESTPALIVLDAAEMQAPPGTVALFEGAGMDEFLGGGRPRSVHEVSLLDLMAIATLGGHLPPRRALIGIQPQSIDWDDEPSPAVRQAMTRACALALDLIGRWRS